MPFDFAIQIRNGKRLGEPDPAIPLYPRDDLIGRGVEVGASAVAFELEFLAMAGDRLSPSSSTGMGIILAAIASKAACAPR